MLPSSPAPSNAYLSSVLLPGVSVSNEVELLLRDAFLDPTTKRAIAEFQKLSLHSTFTATSLPLVKSTLPKNTLPVTNIRHYDQFSVTDLRINSSEEQSLVFTNCTLHRATPATTSALRLWRFANCELNGSDFSKLSLSHTIFVSCDLSGADFTSTYFNNCIFHDCTLKGTKFTSASFTRTRLLRSNPHDATFARARVDAVLTSDVGRAYTTEGLAELKNGNVLQTLLLNPAWVKSRVPACSLRAITTLLEEHPELSASAALALTQALCAQ